jgi:hypothetical protein
MPAYKVHHIQLWHCVAVSLLMYLRSLPSVSGPPEISCLNHAHRPFNAYLGSAFCASQTYPRGTGRTL